ncbi:hypothetical protein GCM10007231_05550 [Nocardioides daphniae]|uniref:Uncharacterized protein n=1 Tax=Nocardioides daphniae TaxID=402297 RepID=A0ABQ1Q0M4_9ACTN|nr:hypothetical protein GCM10007231_05550 [Nocardioides daphniae]
MACRADDVYRPIGVVNAEGEVAGKDWSADPTLYRQVSELNAAEYAPFEKWLADEDTTDETLDKLDVDWFGETFHVLDLDAS